MNPPRRCQRIEPRSSYPKGTRKGRPLLHYWEPSFKQDSIFNSHIPDSEGQSIPLRDLQGPSSSSSPNTMPPSLCQPGTVGEFLIKYLKTLKHACPLLFDLCTKGCKDCGDDIQRSISGVHRYSLNWVVSEFVVPSRHYAQGSVSSRP